MGPTGPIGDITIASASVGYLPIYTRAGGTFSFLGATAVVGTGTAQTSILIAPNSTTYPSTNRLYTLPALTTAPYGTLENAPNADFVLNVGDQDINGIKSFRRGMLIDLVPNNDASGTNPFSRRLIFRRPMPTFLGSPNSFFFQNDVSISQRGWVNGSTLDAFGYLPTGRSNSNSVAAGPNGSSVLNYLMRQNSSSRTFAKTFLTDDMDVVAFGRTVSSDT
jgi:hypothetical protein